MRLILADKMANAKKIVITTQKRELVIVQRFPPGKVGICSLCPTEQAMMTLDDAVDRTGISTLNLIGQLGPLGIHSYETTAGHLLICQESLKKISPGVK